MTRSFSHYTNGVRFYLSRKLKIFSEDQKIAAFGSSHIGLRPPAGAAEGCDLLMFASTQNNQMPQHLTLLKPQHAL
jgi:hypothetical protein